MKNMDEVHIVANLPYALECRLLRELCLVNLAIQIYRPLLIIIGQLMIELCSSRPVILMEKSLL